MIKTYVLLDHTRPTAPIYQRLAKDKRVRIDKLPKWRPLLQATFSDEKSINHTIRLKLNANTVFLDEQVKAGIDANAKYSMNERRAADFTDGVLVTNNLIVQKYLEVYPGNEAFKGSSYDVPRKMFKEVDATKEMKTKNEDLKRRVAAAGKIMSLDLKSAQDLLLNMFGIHYKLPTELEECQNRLIDHLDQSDNAVDQILQDEFRIDEEVSILLGRLMNADLISYNKIKGYVSRKKDGEWMKVKAISADYSQEQRERMFHEYLSTPSGLALLSDLNKDIEAYESNGKKADKEVSNNKNGSKKGEAKKVKEGEEKVNKEELIT